MDIIIIDDDKLVRMSLKTIIEASSDIKVLATGESGEEAIKLYSEHRPDILLMDIRMGGMTGIDAAKEILKTSLDARILFLTTFADDEYIITALKIGAKGYILKQHYDAIVPALTAVFEGHSVFGEEIISKIPSIMTSETAKKDCSDFGLVEKELEIIGLVAEGLSNKEISSKLFLSEGTVRNYISIILEKLCLRDRTQLAIFYFKNLV
ncbi:MAG TPA: response regulator transcription factor [Oscillospiraceae bacterium]|nr:response regulator transcription factor [Oscillospiraceae bacterium]